MWMRRIEDNSQTLSKRLLHDGEAHTTNTRAAMAAGEEKRGWAGADVDLEHDDKKDRREVYEKDVTYEDDLPGFEHWAATLESASKSGIAWRRGTDFRPKSGRNEKRWIGLETVARELQGSVLQKYIWVTIVKGSQILLAYHCGLDICSRDVLRGRWTTPWFTVRLDVLGTDNGHIDFTVICEPMPAKHATESINILNNLFANDVGFTALANNKKTDIFDLETLRFGHWEPQSDMRERIKK